MVCKFIRSMHANNVKRLSFHQVQLWDVDVDVVGEDTPTNPTSPYGEIN